MSVVLPRSPALDSGLRGVPRWWRAWSAMNRRHLAAWLLASASMAVVDLTAVVDKLHMAGVSKIIAWDWVTALIIFGLSLLAWVAAVDGAPAHGHTRNVRVGWAVVVAAVLAACIAVPVMHMLGDRPTVVGDERQDQAAEPPLAMLIIGNSIHFIAWTALFVAAAEVVQRRALTNEADPREPARAGDAGARRAGVATRRDAGAGRAAVPVRHAGRHREAVPDAISARPPSNLDRLITYLRVALPRLRDAGSTVAAEFELVEAYLDVVRSLHGGAPALTVTAGRRLSRRALLSDAATAAGATRGAQR